jgi:hypothetical protein
MSSVLEHWLSRGCSCNERQEENDLKVTHHSLEGGLSVDIIYLASEDRDVGGWITLRWTF